MCSRGWCVLLLVIIFYFSLPPLVIKGSFNDNCRNVDFHFEYLPSLFRLETYRSKYCAVSCCLHIPPSDGRYLKTMMMIVIVANVVWIISKVGTSVSIWKYKNANFLIILVTLFFQRRRVAKMFTSQKKNVCLFFIRWCHQCCCDNDYLAFLK